MKRLIERLLAPVPKIIKRVQIISASLAGLDAVVIALQEKFPSIVIPTFVLNSVLWITLANFVLLQFTKHDDFKS